MTTGLATVTEIPQNVHNRGTESLWQSHLWRSRDSNPMVAQTTAESLFEIAITARSTFWGVVF